LLIATIDLNN